MLLKVTKSRLMMLKIAEKQKMIEIKTFHLKFIKTLKMLLVLDMV
jgi:hypothetical protein